MSRELSRDLLSPNYFLYPLRLGFSALVERERHFWGNW